MVHMKLSISRGCKKGRVKYPKCQMRNSAQIFIETGQIRNSARIFIETVILMRNLMKLQDFCLVLLPCMPQNITNVLEKPSGYREL
jgi:hypothetical protein